VYGLAGLRLGYAVGSPAAIDKMRPYLTEDAVNTIVAEIAGVALSDKEGIREAVTRNTADRQEFLNKANGRNLKPIDPHANFAMINTMHPAEGVIEHFRKHNVLIGRQFPLMETYIRVSFGTPDQMEVFWRAWDMLPFAKEFMQH
jgi:histidinol-phosphate aminotransferase